ncbi:aldo/keto reductase [Sphingobium vermicomposti]|uniref:Aryl-alcohol dehydrogenase-like predicted oxidoreductase n=1 Tax=Sphingobium vermicomposti TaxID=529005 RepID=A0A846MAJ1_9SPHN|nr:aldo/keto reductase [Sphingobium vermicomposti]NIJ17831.1 aryl-alcohol dehydrogenase-like predicted oxidoreductase [Sphingobium vermicomposti]
MQTRNLGKSDLKVSVAGLGCNNFGWFLDREKSLEVIGAAIDAGINFFDTANNYGFPPGESERILGEAVRGRRDGVIIATKVGDKVGDSDENQGAAPAYVRQALEQSLTNLGTDYVDLYQLHYPDPKVPIAETLGAFDQLIQEGKVRYVGCANHSAAQLAEALDAAGATHRAAFISCQSEYSLLARDVESDLAPLMAKNGVGFLPYFPLANGLLTGKYLGGDDSAGRLETLKQIPFFEKFLTPERFEKVGRLAEISRRSGIPMVTLALGWLAAQPFVSSVIAGATKAEQVRANAEACMTALPQELLSELDQL